METHTKFSKWALILGIVIVLNLFFNYTLSLVYGEPKYEDYIKQTQVVENIKTKEECLNIGGQWSEGQKMESVKTGEEIFQGWCDQNYTNQKNYDNARKIYERNVFITLVILGVISLTVGVFVSNIVLAPALAFGGVLSFIIASMRYWSLAEKGIRVFILFVALASLIWLAIKKFNQK